MSAPPSPVSPPFLLLTSLFGDPVTSDIFSERRTVEGWLEAERALAKAQARIGVLAPEDAESIAGAAVLRNVDLDKLWGEARNVGYPILPLVKMVAASLPDGPAGRVHYGATTQDIMATGLALQLRGPGPPRRTGVGVWRGGGCHRPGAPPHGPRGPDPRAAGGSHDLRREAVRAARRARPATGPGRTSTPEGGCRVPVRGGRDFCRARRARFGDPRDDGHTAGTGDARTWGPRSS